ncbi:MAG: DNRLRE domain-containing protein [Phycisphaerae bacterium]|nr:DNRLRE domain-containing protein [Phycisphaerae bacterium]
MKRTLLVGCVVLCAAAAATDAAVVTYVTSADVYIEWTIGDGGISNRNTKGLLKTQWSGSLAEPTAIVKSYLKFQVPTDVLSLNSVTLRLTSDTAEGRDNDGKTLDIWVLPEAYDGWSQTVLDWNQATSTYANDPSGVAFTAGEQVGSGVCNAGKAVATDFSLDITKLLPYVQADTNGVITLTLPARVGTTTYWCDLEDSESTYRPRLILDYEVPEPATMSLLVLGGLACIRRRR